MYIDIRNNLGIPKYRQIIQSVEKAIAEEKITKGSRLPSVNKVCLAFKVSRDTVLLAYDELKKRGIVFAIPGKGYYIRSTEVKIRERIFMLFDELNIFKEDLYNSFLTNVGPEALVDLFFHHFNPVVCKNLLLEANGNYTKYVIMPTNLDIAAEIAALPASEVYILDQTNDELRKYPAVYQNFVKDMYNALLEGRNLLEKYHRMVIIFPGFREPLGMRDGFMKFCTDYSIPYEVIPQFAGREITPGEVYIIPNDRDLVSVIEKGNSQNLVLGKDYGIISYNETPLKKVVADGITTISTDFEMMGKSLAEMILSGNKEQIENKCSLILRKSL